MSNKVYYIQPNSGMRQPTRQTVYPHVLKPSQIVIKHRQPQHEDFLDDVDETDILEFDGQQQKPQRRRERLNHLSQEEKLNRRKMKNREAAQNARDRKKVQSQTMEQTVRQLVAENRRLKAENAKLRRLAGSEYQQPEMPLRYIPSDLSENSSSSSPVESAADSGLDEFYPQSPSILSECVEVYATTEAIPQQQENYQNYSRTEEWNADEVYPTSYAPNESIQHQQQNVSNTQLPQQFVDLQTYDNLVESPFIDELCLELDQWSNDPSFAQEMEAEKEAIVNTTEGYQAAEMIDDIDLFEFCNF